MFRRQKWLKDQGSICVALLQNERGAAMHRRYLVLDLYTLASMVSASVVLGEDLHQACSLKAKTIAQDLFCLVEYGRTLTRLALVLCANDQGLAMPLDFSSLDWIPDAISRQIPASAPENGVFDMRDHKDKAACAAMMKALRLEAPAVAWFVSRFRRNAAGILAKDSHELQLTRFLPPTVSLPDASFDGEAFLAQA